MQSKFMNTGILMGAALLAVLSGSVGCVHETRQVREYPPAPPYTHSALVMEDDYVYYPAYEVYYSNHRHQYIYRDGRSWVSRPAPPHVTAEVLFAAPSVRMDFHDAPAAHHAAVVRQYPQHWAPPGHDHGNKGGNQGHSEGNGKGKNERDGRE